MKKWILGAVCGASFLWIFSNQDCNGEKRLTFPSGLSGRADTDYCHPVEHGKLTVKSFQSDDAAAVSAVIPKGTVLKISDYRPKEH